MSKTASVVMSLCLCSVVLGCGASSADAEPAGTEEDANAAESAQGGAAPDLSAPSDVAAPPADAMFTTSGLASKVLVAGEGTRRPRATDRVRVDYSGWQTDGTLFDSSLRRGMPSEFGLDGVIDGWTEGLQLMVEGEQRRFWIPEELAYRGTRDRPSGMLVFDVELISILTP